MKNTNTYSRLEHQHFGVGGGEERAGLAKVEDSEIGPRHVMPLSSRHISFMERVDIFLPWKVTWTEGWSILGKTISSRVCPLDSASARLHLFCHLLHGLPWSLLLLGSTTKKNRFRISSPFPCIIYCHKDVESSFFLEMGVHPHFRKFVKTLKKKTFLQPKRYFLVPSFYFPFLNSYRQLRFAKKTNSIWSIWNSKSRAPFAIYTPIYGDTTGCWCPRRVCFVDKDVKLLKCCCWKRILMQVVKISRCQL